LTIEKSGNLRTHITSRKTLEFDPKTEKFTGDSEANALAAGKWQPR